MKKLAALIAAGTFVLAPAAFAADAPKAAAGATTTSAPAMKMEKPASVTQEAWDKMTDAQKKDAVDKAKMAKKDSTSTTPMKKDKKGGC